MMPTQGYGQGYALVTQGYGATTGYGIYVRHPRFYAHPASVVTVLDVEQQGKVYVNV